MRNARAMHVRNAVFVADCVHVLVPPALTLPRRRPRAPSAYAERRSRRKPRLRAQASSGVLDAR